eukprot:Nk52_evm62s217 gene=Nk52_evmTU62s217
MSAVKRLLKELQSLEKAGKRHGNEIFLPLETERKSETGSSSTVRGGPFGFWLQVNGSDLTRWTVYMRPGPDSLYREAEFELCIVVPEQYPIRPPVIKFVTKICHPNVHFKTGEICLDILSTSWSPVWTLQSCLLAISLLLDTPEVDSPLNCDAGNLIRCGDERGYRSLARMYARLYAKLKARPGVG